MMSVLYNFVKADTNAFLSNPKHIEIILAMCKQVSQQPNIMYSVIQDS